MSELLVDTDVLIDHLRGHRRFEPRRARIAYSVITRAELYAGKATDEAIVDRLLAPFREIVVDRAIAATAGRLRRKLAIRTPDALIAATALEHRCTLLTRNRADFANIPKLPVRSP
ncbi:MAG: type II toxin-antitoxin system VapC family toxin [Myxococcota bacterium]|nr:type II toxin-antitoxin system VapC family toxin [Myxococcota bacterium]